MKKIENTFDCSARLTALDERYSFVSKQFSRSCSSLYQFLGECHALITDIGSDGARVETLNEALKATNSVTDRERTLATSVTAKVVLYVFRKPDGDLSNRSTRSNYKRAIQKAVDSNLSTAEFVSALEQGGIVSFMSVTKTPSTASRNEQVDEKRAELVANTVPCLSSIGLIENKNPTDTFAVVIYRVDCGQLVPCYVTDDSKAVNSLVSAIIPIDRQKLLAEAEAHAAQARMEFLEQRKVA